MSLKIFIHGNKKDNGYILISVIIVLVVTLISLFSLMELYSFYEKNKLKNNLQSQKQFLEIKRRENGN